MAAPLGDTIRRGSAIATKATPTGDSGNTTAATPPQIKYPQRQHRRISAYETPEQSQHHRGGNAITTMVTPSRGGRGGRTHLLLALVI